MTCPSAAKKSCSSHLLGVGQGVADKTALVQELSKAITFFCLRSYPGEISHSNLANRELSNDVSLLEVLPRKVALHTSSHLTPIEAWRSAVSTTSEHHRISSEAWLENCTQVWGWAKFGQRATHGGGKIASHLFWLVQTCPNLSEPVRNTLTMYARPAMSFFAECSYSSVLRRILVKLHILTRLIKGFAMVWRLLRCIEVKLSVPLWDHS